MAKARRKTVGPVQDELGFSDEDAQDSPGGESGEDLVPEGKLVCALTGDFRKDTDQERTLQQLIEQLHREYSIAYGDMDRDVRLPCYAEDPETGRIKTKSRSVSLVVYERGRSREPKNIIRAAIVVKPGTKPEPKVIGVLDEVLGSLSDQRPQVFGAWTNGEQLAFRMAHLREAHWTARLHRPDRYPRTHGDARRPSDWDTPAPPDRFGRLAATYLQTMSRLSLRQSVDAARPRLLATPLS